MAVHTRQGVVKCVGAPRAFFKEPKKKGKVYIKKDRTTRKLEAEDAQSSTILFTKTNLNYKIMHKIVKLPFNVKPGMTVTVNGAYIKGEKYTQLSVIQDPKHPTSIFGWLHVRVMWPVKKLIFSVGMTTTVNNNTNIISDPSNFTLAIMLKPSSTKFYADNVLIFSAKAIPWMEEVVIRKYSKVYQLVVQKTGEEERKDIML